MEQIYIYWCQTEEAIKETTVLKMLLLNKVLPFLLALCFFSKDGKLKVCCYAKHSFYPKKI